MINKSRFIKCNIKKFVYQIGIQSKNDNLSYGLYLEPNLFAETTSIKKINCKIWT